MVNTYLRTKPMVFHLDLGVRTLGAGANSPMIYTQMARVLINLMRLLIIQQVGAFQRQYSFGRPVGPLPFTVNGSNNTAELQAPPEAIAFMLLHPPFPPALFATWIPNTS